MFFSYCTSFYLTLSIIQKSSLVEPHPLSIRLQFNYSMWRGGNNVSEIRKLQTQTNCTLNKIELTLPLKWSGAIFNMDYI